MTESVEGAGDNARRKTLDEEVGAAIRSAREDARMTQASLADRMGKLGFKIDPTALTKIERGQRSLRLNQLAIVAEALEVRVADLLGVAGETPIEMFERGRYEADQAMHSARRSLERWAEHLMDVRDALEARPDLLGRLVDEAVEPPHGPSDYFRWVADRISRIEWAAGLAGSARTPAERDAFREAAQAIVANLIFTEDEWTTRLDAHIAKFREAELSGEKLADGVDPEA